MRRARSEATGSGTALLVALLCAAAPGEALCTEEPGARLVLMPQVSLATEYDSNARRLPEVPGDPGSKSRIVGDGLLRLESSLAGRLERPGFAVTFDTALGAKLFFEEESERMAVAQGSVTLDAALPFELTARLSTFGKVRGQASGARGYALERTEAYLERRLPFGLALKGGLVGQVFHSGDTPVFSSAGGGPLLRLAWRLSSQESAELGLEAEARCFPFGVPVREQQEGLSFGSDVRRCDAPLRTTLSFTSTRRLFLSAGYVGERNLSNSRGESYSRHRLFAMMATRLPYDVTAALRGAVQLTRYDDGISLGQRLFLGEDDESQNGLQLSLSRPWFGGLEVEARLSWYGNELAKGGVRFSRTTASLGVRAEL